MNDIPKGYEEIFAELDREYEEEQVELAEEYKALIVDMVMQIDRMDTLAGLYDFLSGLTGDLEVDQYE